MTNKKIPTYFDFLNFDDSMQPIDDYVYGSNTLGAAEIFVQRKKYQQVHPDSSQSEFVGEKMDEFFSYLGTKPPVGRPMPINFLSPVEFGYGRYDTNKDCIYPKQFYLKQIGNSSNVFVLNFVADAFEDLIKYIKIEKQLSLVNDDFLTKDLKPARGVQVIERIHSKILDAHYSAVRGMILDEQRYNSTIVDFESFIEHFLNVYGSLALKEYPLSKSSLLHSNKVGPNVSGLCIELSKEAHDKDKPKKQKYLDSPNYSFYTAAAAQFGFLVDKNAPWRLVANVYSPKMRPYIQKYFQTYSNEGWTAPNLNHSHYYMGYTNSLVEDSPSPQKSIETAETHTYSGDPVVHHTHVITKDGEVSIEIASLGGTHDGTNPGKYLPDHTHGISAKEEILDWSASDVYNKFYEKSIMTDIQEVKTAIINFYNRLVSENPIANVSQVCYNSADGYFLNADSSKTEFKQVRRQSYKDEGYGDLFWYKTYVILRLAEMGKNHLINKENIDKVMSDINQIYYFLDNGAVTVYINDYLKQHL
jgi:hypothetical protein